MTIIITILGITIISTTIFNKTVLSIKIISTSILGISAYKYSASEFQCYYEGFNLFIIVSVVMPNVVAASVKVQYK
jgi:hypothetical protein